MLLYTLEVVFLDQSTFSIKNVCVVVEDSWGPLVRSTASVGSRALGMALAFHAQVFSCFCIFSTYH